MALDAITERPRGNYIAATQSATTMQAASATPASSASGSGGGGDGSEESGTMKRNLNIVTVPNAVDILKQCGGQEDLLRFVLSLYMRKHLC
jgi:hypothetical protein